MVMQQLPYVILSEGEGSIGSQRPELPGRCPGVNEMGRNEVSTQSNSALSFPCKRESNGLDPGYSSPNGSEFRDDRRGEGLLNSAKAVAEPRACPGGATDERLFPPRRNQHDKSME